MKNLLSSLKSLDFKEFAIRHGEKVALSVVGLIVLLTLALGTQWSRYNEIAPDELSEKAATTGQQVRTSGWPETEKLALEASTTGPAHPQRRVASMLADQNLDDPRFDFTMGPVIWEPLPRSVPIREPKWYQLIEPIASHGRIILDIPQLVAAEDPMGVAVGDGVDTRRDEGAIVARKRTQFDPRQGGVGAGGGESFDPGAGLGMRLQGFAPPGFESPEGQPGGFGEFDGEVSGPSSGLATHFVSVRMVFPARAQLQAILNARGIGAVASADLFSIQDFEIERSQAIAGPDGEIEWTEWKSFDLDKTLELLDLVSGFDTETLHPQVIDQTITMPLPMPKYGYWQDVHHPRLKDAVLSAEQQQQFGQFAEAMAQTREQFNEAPGFEFGAGEAAGENADVEKGGWAPKIRDFKSEVSEVAADQERARATFDVMRTQGGVGALNLQTLSATGEYLLFRFVDFDVEPGRAYRYRARLKFLNPNYDLPIDRVLRPSVAEGLFRPNPLNDQEMEAAWSASTNPVVVPDDLEYYVAGVTRSLRSSEANAKIRVHVWSDVLGTWVSEVVEVAPGERVGGSGPENTDVANLVADTFEKGQPVRFEADDVLADLVATPVLDLNDGMHAQYLAGLGEPRLEVVAPVVVLNEYGELVEHDPGAKSDARDAARTRYEDQMTALETLLAPQADTEGLGGNPLESGEGFTDFYGEGGEGAVAPQPRKRRRVKKGNPLRIGGN